MEGEPSESASASHIPVGTEPPVEMDRPIGVERERPIGVERERPIGASRPPSNGGCKSMGLTMGDYVPTTREIEEGTVKVTEVAPPPEQQYVLTEDLPPLEDCEAQLQFAVDHMETRDWAERFDVMHVTRKLVKYQPRCLDCHIARVSKCLVESMGNPRSSIIRESLMLTADLLGCLPLKEFIAEGITWTKLVPALLLKAINDKKFLAVEGTNALEAFSTVCPEGYDVFLKHCDNKNAKLAVMAISTVKSCVLALGDRLREKSWSSPDLGPLTTSAVKATLKGKLADMRSHGKACLDRVIAVAGGWDAFVADYGATISASDMKQLRLIYQPEGEIADEPPLAEAVSKARAAPGSARPRSRFARGAVVAQPEVDMVVTVAAPPRRADVVADACVVVDGDTGAGDTPISRVRRNSTTPRSRRSAEAVVMEF